MTTRSRPGNRNRLAVAILGALAAALLPAFAIVAPVAAAGLGPPNTWVPTGQMHVARAGQTATALPDGTVLVAGGGTARAELYNPATRTFSPTAPLPVPVVLLPVGYRNRPMYHGIKFVVHPRIAFSETFHVVMPFDSDNNIVGEY